MEIEKQEKKDQFGDKRSTLSLVLEWVISFLVLSVIAIAAGFLDVYSRGVSYENKTGMVYADAFAISGVLCLCFWLLLFVSRKGAFDIIVYGVKKLIDVTFHSKPENSKLPATYYEYVKEQRSKEHRAFTPFLVFSIIFSVVGLVLSIIFQ